MASQIIYTIRLLIYIAALVYSSTFTVTYSILKTDIPTITEQTKERTNTWLLLVFAQMPFCKTFFSFLPTEPWTNSMTAKERQLMHLYCARSCEDNFMLPFPISIKKNSQSTNKNLWQWENILLATGNKTTKVAHAITHRLCWTLNVKENIAKGITIGDFYFRKNFLIYCTFYPTFISQTTMFLSWSYNMC